MPRQGSREGGAIPGLEGMVAAGKKGGRVLRRYGPKAVLILELAHMAGVALPPKNVSADTGAQKFKPTIVGNDTSVANLGAGTANRDTSVSHGNSPSAGNTSQAVFDRNNDSAQNVTADSRVTTKITGKGAVNIRARSNDGPDSALIAQQRSEANPNDHPYFGTPIVIGKGGRDTSVSNSPPKDDPEWVQAVKQGEHIASELIKGFLEFSLTACSSPIEQRGTATPTISPITPADEAAFAQAILAKSTGNNVDFKSLSNREKLLNQYVDAVTKILRSTVGDKQVSKYRMEIPISEKVFHQWEASGALPAHILVNQDTGEKSIAVSSKYWNDSHLQSVPQNTEIGVTSEGYSLQLIQANGEINEYTGEAWGTRVFNASLGMFVDTSQYPIDDPRILSQMTQDFKDRLYGIAQDAQKIDPAAQMTWMPHINKDGKLTNTFYEHTKKGRRLWQMGSDSKIRSPNEDELALAHKKVRYEKASGQIMVQVEGTGLNSGEFYDDKPFSPDPDVVVAAPIPPTPQPTVAPTATKEPTATPEVKAPEILPQNIIFQDDFESGFFQKGPGSKYWNYNNNVWSEGVDLSIKDVREVLTNSKDLFDKYGNPRGKVMVVKLNEPVQIPSFGKGYWYAGYPGWFNNDIKTGVSSLLPQTSGVKVDIWAPPNIGDVSVLSGHRKNAITGDTISVAAMEIHKGDKISVLARDDKGKDTRVVCKDGLYIPGAFNEFMFIVDKATGRVLPFINGKFALNSIENAPVVPIGSDAYPGTMSDFHAGVNDNAQTKETMDSYIRRGTVVVNDNFQVFIIQ